MAGLAFVYEFLAVLVAAFVLVRFLNGARGLPDAPERRRKRQGPITGLSVVLLLDKDSDVTHSVAALLAEDYGNLQIIVVLSGVGLDKATRAKLEADARVTLLEAGPAGLGWMGRPHGFDAGFRRAEHDLVLFTDGSLLLRSDALGRAVSMFKQRRADVLTIFPELTATTFAERLMVPFFMQLILMGVSFRRINDASDESAGMFAPFLMCRREAYEGVGGFVTFRGERSADAALIRLLKETGHRLVMGNGVELAVMIGQDTFPAIWTSWSRSFNEATGNEPKQAAILAGLVFAVFAAPSLILAGAIAMSVISTQTVAESPWIGAVLMGAAYVAVAYTHRRALRNVLRIEASLAWLQPLAALITCTMILTSSLSSEERLSESVGGGPEPRQPRHGSRPGTGGSRLSSPRAAPPAIPSGLRSRR